MTNTRYFYVKQTHGAVENENGTTFGKGDLAFTDSTEVAEQWKQGGTVEEINADIVNEAENKINSLSDEYKRKEEKIKNSNDPALLIEGKQDYEIKLLREEEKEVTEQIRKDYEKARHDLIKEAEKAQLLATTKVTESDKVAAESYVNRFIANAYADYNKATQQFTETLEYLSDSELSAIQKHLPKIHELIYEKEDKSVNAGITFNIIADRVSEGNPIPIADAIKQLPSAESLGIKQKQRAAIRQAFESKNGDIITELQQPSTRQQVEREEMYSGNSLGSDLTRQRNARQ